MMGLLWDSAEEKLAKAVAAAQTEVVKHFDVWTAQQAVVAEKRKTYESMKLLLNESQKNFQLTSAIYESALTTLDTNSQEVSDLRSSFLVRESDVKQKTQQLADCNKNMQAAISVLVQKEKEKIAAENKLENILRPKGPASAVVSSPVLEPAKSVEKSEPQKVESTRADFVAIHQLLENSMRFRGTRISPPMPIIPGPSHAGTRGNFDEIHRKLEKLIGTDSVQASSSTPANTPSNAGVMFGMSQHLSQEATRKLLCTALHEKFNQTKPAAIPDELKQAIIARRKCFE